MPPDAAVPRTHQHLGDDRHGCWNTDPGSGRELGPYLLYLAWQTLRDKSPIETDAAAAAVPFLSTIRTAVLINLLNPKLTIFFFAFLPQFVPTTEQAAWLHMTALSLVFMAVTFIVFGLYGIFAAGMRAQVLSRPKVVAWMRRSFAATYVLLAGRLAVVEK